jgi:hypothetical protein
MRRLASGRNARLIAIVELEQTHAFAMFLGKIPWVGGDESGASCLIFADRPITIDNSNLC